MKNIEYNNSVKAIIRENSNQFITLKDFLINLSFGIEKHKKGITPESLLLIVQDSFIGSFESDIDSFKDEVASNLNEPDNTYDAFKSTILSQIYDLEIMEASAATKQEELGSGYNSPRGNRWYNFNVEDYLECSSDWLLDYYGNETIFNTNWVNLIRVFEMGRLYE